MAAATVATLAGAAACSGSGNDDSAGAEPVEPAGATAQLPEPPDPCEFVDPTVPANAAAFVVDTAEQVGGASELGTLATRTCTFGSDTDVMVVSTLTYTGEAEAARAQILADVQADGGQVLDIDLRSLPRNSLVTQTTGLVAVTVLEAPDPFVVGFNGLGSPTSAVTAAEAVLAAT
jgi:hypothetical protein